jgi:RimJ/RimL family protein N-acetyltransferase
VAVQKAVLETKRMWLREMSRDDVDALLRVFGDQETMRYYPAPFTRDQVEGWIDWNLANYERHGYGLWALVLKETGEVIGDCGLTWQRVGYKAERELEAGWHVRRDLWKRGLATEAGISVRDYARDRLGHPRLISKIEPGNLASQAVARKVGMALERRDLLDGKELLIYAMRLEPGR